MTTPPDRRSGPSVVSGTAHKLGDETSSSLHSVDPRDDMAHHVTGVVVIDLTAVAEERRRHRVGALATAPIGAVVELVVGPLRVTPDAARLLREYGRERRLSVVVKGEPYAVGAWVGALRSGVLCGVLL